MLEKFLDKMMSEEETGMEEIKRHWQLKKLSKKKKKFNWLILAFSLIIFLLALGVRLFFLFKIEDPQNAHPGWYEDTYHHWQIAYLSLKVGFKQGFLRLWDLKGMEYFWGLLHPLVLAFLMKITGSSSIVIARLLSLFCGSLNVVFIWLLVRRYFGWQAGLSTALIVVLSPVAIYSDASGMQEPLGILMFLTALYFWPRKAWLTGSFIMLAGMVRAEYWLISIGLMLIIIIAKEKLESKILALLAFGIFMLLYMKYLLDKTGNAVYPMYWNFMGNMKGEWQAKILPNPNQLLAQRIYIGVLVAAVVFSLLLLWKRPKYLTFFFLGIGNWILLGLTVGLSKYLLSYLPRFWVDRIMVLPYMFLAVWFSALIFKVFGRRWFSLVGWLLVIPAILMSQMAWKQIWYWRGITNGQWENKKALAQAVARHYQGGRILFFEDHPASTYWLVYKLGVEANNIIGQMFDPYFYMEGDPYENWGKNRKIIFDWLKKEDIRLLGFFPERERYLKLVAKEPDSFEKLEFNPVWNLLIYRVNLK